MKYSVSNLMDVINMVMSMTGYGQDVFHLGNTTVTVEIRSVNHRFFDFTAKIPRSLLFLEDKIKRTLQLYFQRGRMEVYINVQGDGLTQKELYTDWDLMDKYIDQIKSAKARYNLAGEIPVTIMPEIPDLLSVQETENYSDELINAITTSVKRACEQLLLMREEEGDFLLKDISNRMLEIQDTVSHLQTRRESVIEEYRERIQSRIYNFLGENDVIDQTRMHQEIALLAEKGDITEEITRLQSHIDHFSETIDLNDAIGRKLDFIMQEMHREANTVGSKSTDAKIGVWIVALKSEIEKIKEQIQNIE
ncbi:YicC/YloC family endoribonuclease [Virgibacillus sp. L01]|uniref:YicC/YloC family endoribonuclease n=1 Tax=Virgibacillus sp. L01 TaxID=3457429 RepID=UPI003FD624A4